ncbi:MAG TPA: BPSS1780 family membrane protein [Gammaproteobacteria bacterium]|nr:BPSS1780 family membrane protein [Gammaproteobacteria bacterium]
MAENPYAAPRTHVEDVPAALPDGDFIPEGRGVPAGRGWGWIADAWGFMGGQRWTFVGVFLLMMILYIGANFLPILGPLAVSLFSPVLLGGFVLGCDALRRGQRFEVGHLFAGFQRHAGKLVALGAISLAFAIVSAAIMILIVGTSVLPMFTGGEPNPEEIASMLLPMLLALLVIMAASLPLSMAFLFAMPLIVLRDSDVGPALKTSFFACLKNILPFLVWSLAMFGLYLLSAFTLFLALLLLFPVAMVSLYLAYREVFHDI